MKTVIFGNGERLVGCAEVLKGEPSLSKYSELVILPIPTTRDGFRLTGIDMTLEELSSTVGEGSFVLGYGIPVAYVEAMEDAGATVCDAAGDEIFLGRNAELTALGTVGVLLTSGRASPQDMRIGIIGYGRIGSQLMRILLFLGARVRVYTRRNSTRVELCGYGIDAELSSEGNFSDLDFLINTAPCQIFSQKELRRLDAGTTVIDLASGNCFPEGSEIKKLGSIPGIMYPASAGRIYAEAAVRYQGGEGV